MPQEQIDPVALPPVEVSDVVMDEQDISFHVDQVGVPVLVKVSYFPNWTAHGAEGPYRIAPNMMVVIPTSNDVRLTFDRSTSDIFFYALTGIGILLLIASRIWGDRLLAAIDRRSRAGTPAFAGAAGGCRRPACAPFALARARIGTLVVGPARPHAATRLGARRPRSTGHRAGP